MKIGLGIGIGSNKGVGLGTELVTNGGFSSATGHTLVGADLAITGGKLVAVAGGIGQIRLPNRHPDAGKNLSGHDHNYRKGRWRCNNAAGWRHDRQRHAHNDSRDVLTGSGRCYREHDDPAIVWRAGRYGGGQLVCAADRVMLDSARSTALASRRGLFHFGYRRNTLPI